jgi:Ca-activated chloride channel family protein
MMRSLVTSVTVLAIALSGLANSANAGQVKLSVAMSNPILKANKKQISFLRVGLTGFKMDTRQERPPVNIAIVLDKSGSMSGQKIVEARRAAIAAINRLNGNDIVSVITYDSTVNVLIPATKLTDKRSVTDKIAQIQAGGRTALFAGVSKASAEIRKFIDKDRFNRIILLSDGKANVGPMSPSELGRLGMSLKKEGISVSTMGLGLDYNEDLMVAIAKKSGGNHFFIEDAQDLAGVFEQEFNDVLSVVAQEIAVTIKLNDKMRPVRVLGNDAEINGQEVVTLLTQLYSEQDKFIVLEVEIPASPEGKPKKVADVSVSYDNMSTKAIDRLSATVSVNFTNETEKISKSLNKPVLESCIMLLANERNKRAIVLRDQGKVDLAKKVLTDNAYFLSRYAKQLNSSALDLMCKQNQLWSTQLGAKAYIRSRKALLEQQYQLENNQRPVSPKR